jgi:hypothetical protein
MKGQQKQHVRSKMFIFFCLKSFKLLLFIKESNTPKMHIFLSAWNIELLYCEIFVFVSVGLLNYIILYTVSMNILCHSICSPCLRQSMENKRKRRKEASLSNFSGKTWPTVLNSVTGPRFFIQFNKTCRQFLWKWHHLIYVELMCELT